MNKLRKPRYAQFKLILNKKIPEFADIRELDAGIREGEGKI